MSNLTYQQHKSWNYPTDLIKIIVNEIQIFYKDYNQKKVGGNKIQAFNNEPAFAPLLILIKSIPGIEREDAPTLGWLQDFYNGAKRDTKVKKRYFECLLKTFGYIYYPDTNSFEKKAIDTSEEGRLREKKMEIIDFLNRRSRKGLQLKEFTGIYKYFVGGRREGSVYDYIYENELEIYNNGQVEIRNPFNGHTYYGLAIVTSISSLQIISYNFDEGLIDGIGNIMTFSVNGYFRKVKLIPGLGLTFDADGRPIATEALLCTDVTLNKQSKIIREYFDETVTQLRLYCPTTVETEKLVIKYYSTISFK